MSRSVVSVIDLAELRDAAKHDGTSATTVYIGGPGWDVVLALVTVVDAANALTMQEMPKRYGRSSPEWYAAMDRLLDSLRPFENLGDG
jgi:hypothetical protein